MCHLLPLLPPVRTHDLLLPPLEQEHHVSGESGVGRGEKRRRQERGREEEEKEAGEGREGEREKGR